MYPTICYLSSANSFFGQLFPNITPWTTLIQSLTMGRRSSYTEAIANEILERIANGEPLTKICRDDHIPAMSSVFRWEESIPGFREKVTRARELSADHYSHEIIEIADEKPECTISGDGWEKTQVDGAGVQRNKLRIDTRIKLMQMLKRKTYGDKVQAEITGADGGPIQYVAKSILDT